MMLLWGKAHSVKNWAKTNKASPGSYSHICDADQLRGFERQTVLWRIDNTPLTPEVLRVANARAIEIYSL